MPDWGNVYAFGSSDDLTTRVRRLERGRQYLRGGQNVIPSGLYGGIPNDLIDPISLKIPIVSGLTVAGSIPPAGVTGNFGFTATTTSITIYWDGTNGSVVLAILRADNTSVQVPSNNITISGLTINTSYGFLPFRSVFNNCGVGFVVGDSGTPQFAFTTAARSVQAVTQQSLTGREALTPGFITYSTTASGTSSGGGTVPPPTRPMCVMVNTEIKPFGAGQEYVIVHARQTDWINLAVEDLPRTLSCTPDHELISPDRGKQPANSFKVGDWVITDHGEKKLAEVRMFYKDCTKMQVQMPTGHLYFANGFLSHNVKLPQQ